MYHPFSTGSSKGGGGQHQRIGQMAGEEWALPAIGNEDDRRWAAPKRVSDKMKNDDMMSMTWGCKPIYTIFFPFSTLCGTFPAWTVFWDLWVWDFFNFTYCTAHLSLWVVLYNMAPKTNNKQPRMFCWMANGYKPGLARHLWVSFWYGQCGVKQICMLYQIKHVFRHPLVTLSPRGIILKKYMVNHGATSCRICFIGYKPDLHIQIQNSKFKIQHSNWTVDGARFIAWCFWRMTIPSSPT